MAIKVFLADPDDDCKAAIDCPEGETFALAVAMRSLKVYTPYTGLFLNSDYGSDMNQNAAFGGTPEDVHNGTDNNYWTGSAVVGAKFTFDSTDLVGTKSIKTDNAALGGTAQFAKGSSALTVSGYTAISLYIYVDKDWKAGDDIEFYGWDTGTGAIVGNAVGLQDYFNWEVFDAWQAMAIPLADMGLTMGTINALRFQIVAKEGKSPKFYLDDIQVEQTGTPISYTVEPAQGTWLHLQNICTIAVAAYDTDEANGTVPGLAWDDLLGVTLTQGLVYQRWSLGEVSYSQTIRGLADYAQFPLTSWSAAHDGTDTMLTINGIFAPGTILKAEELDKMVFIVQDNLSSLLRLRVSVRGYVEQRG